MPVTLKLQNYDEIFHRITTDKILINNVDIFNTENKELLDNIIMMNYSEDNLSIIPSCKCGELKGEYYVGDVCHKCNTTVINSVDDAISFLLWAQAPKDVEKFISPMAMMILMNRYKITKPNVRLIEYIMLPNLKFDKKQQRGNIALIEKLDFLMAQQGITRGYNSFIRNFFPIIDILETHFMKKPKPGEPNFMEFLLANKDNIFSNVLPFPNRVIFATESNELGRFIDKSLLTPINVIRRLTGIDLYTRNLPDKQNRVAKSVIELARFYDNYMHKSIFPKPGLIRQQIDAARSHFTARAVIVSIAGPHAHDELHICWSVACSLLRPFILNCLYRRGYSYKQAINFLIYHNRIYHPLLDEIFQEIIAYSKTGLKALFNRNPSLHRGSIQLVRITKVKTNPADNTFSMSDRIGPSFNSDHDGDEMNLYLLVTRKMVNAVHPLEPYHNVLGLSGPNEMSSNIKFPKTIISTLSNWINN